MATEKSPRHRRIHMDPLPPDTEKWGSQGKSCVWTWICSLICTSTPSTCIMQFGADAGRELAVLHTTLEAKRIRLCAR